MEFLVYAACLLACGLQFALGIGVTLALRKRLPRAAYWIGFLVPVLIPILLWGLYVLYSSSQPCLPQNQLSCGEADAYTFLLLGGVLLFNFGISSLIQFIMWRVELRRQRIANAAG